MDDYALVKLFGEPILFKGEDFQTHGPPARSPVTGARARIAREAHRDFGNGSGHPAGLNFGDCFAYALAQATGEPIPHDFKVFAPQRLRERR